MKRTSWMAAVALVVVALASAGCATSLNKVLADPSRYKTQEVTVSGDVIDSFSVGTRGVYRLRDSTGEIWVSSDHGVPRKGAHVKVTGTVKEGFNLGPLTSMLPAGLGTGLVLVEREHKGSN